MKWMSNPNDLCVFLSADGSGTRMQLNATWEYGKTTGKLLQPALQGNGKDQGPNRRRTRPRPARAAASAPSPLPPGECLNGRHLGRAGQNRRRISLPIAEATAPSVTRPIYDCLVSHFGEGSVFQDVEDIPLGMDFTEFIQQVVGKWRRPPRGRMTRGGREETILCKV